jgi:hypothetical protein
MEAKVEIYYSSNCDSSETVFDLSKVKHFRIRRRFRNSSKVTGTMEKKKQMRYISRDNMKSLLYSQ